MAQAPSFASEFLEDIAEAFRKRRKSLSHRVSRAECHKVYELVDGKKTERLEVYLQDGTRPRGALLRMHVWPDRLVWLDARIATKAGWAWAWTYEGRLLGNHTGRDVIIALEECIDLLPRMEGSRIGELDGPWKHLVAKGPSEIR